MITQGKYIFVQSFMKSLQIYQRLCALVYPYIHLVNIGTEGIYKTLDLVMFLLHVSLDLDHPVLHFIECVLLSPILALFMNDYPLYDFNSLSPLAL